MVETAVQYRASRRSYIGKSKQEKSGRRVTEIGLLFSMVTYSMTSFNVYFGRRRWCSKIW